MKPFPYQTAINYSGYREDHSPRTKTYPSKEEILEDLTLLQGEFYYLRIYDCSPHGYRVLEVIDEHKLPFKVMLGLSLAAEINHIDHPFFYVHKEAQLQKNKVTNEARIQEIIALAQQYKHIVQAISVGNETRSIWNNNRVTIERLVDATKTIKQATTIPVTFCEEYQTWISDLAPLAKEVDFISLHTYPAWQGVPIAHALETAVANYKQVQDAYPDKYCIITETGWPTKTHGSRIPYDQANIDNQLLYNAEISKWAQANNVLVYLFEAFDEPWKGGNDPDEPEKHWGIYFVNRVRKTSTPFKK